ncbi:MAG: hypothetical protein JWR21_2817 [Herminiimonas sp.]|nr:hypothetical protein [Herminiimonas sp.]
MKRFCLCRTVLLFAHMFALLFAASPGFAASSGDFSFGVIAHAFKDGADETTLRETIASTDAENLAFVVANGIKSSKETCGDTLYLHRKDLFAKAKNGLIVSLAGSDWIGCTSEDGQPVALERLNRLREIFFSDEYSLGESKLPISRQSSISKFRSYGENARWEVNGVVFATINLPAENNHYLAAAGRNSEFEDRVIANRNWLQRTFRTASSRKAIGVVLFFDGDVSAARAKEQKGTDGRRDGFAEFRKEVRTLASGYHGQVLLVHGTAGTDSVDRIRWNANVGDLPVPRGWKRINVARGTATIFTLPEEHSRSNRRAR